MNRPLTLGESLLYAWFVFTAMGCYCALSVWFIDRDMRKLAKEPDGVRLSRAYSTTSFAAAVFAGMLLGFPQVAVLVHFIRTRRSIVGALLGLFWVALTFVPMIAIGFIVDLFVPE
jgi:hypothetical protein